MEGNVYARVEEMPKFAKLVRMRNRFALILSVAMLAMYYTFVLFASSNPEGFAERISEGSSIPTGLLYAWGIQFTAFLFTGIYVLRANSDFDKLNREVIAEATR